MDHPFKDCCETAEKLANQGALVFQKFTCEKCNSRQTIDEPNTFFASGQCEECQHVTDITKTGCNYTVIFSGSPESREKLLELLGK